jgi:tetratricopeptide (TPR) repeat protein
LWGQRERLVAAVLVGLTLLAFRPTLDCSFVNYDDQVYVTGNTHVQAGLTKEGALWGLTTLHFGNWHPLVWWSLMLDAQVYGSDPLGFHLTNLLWHTGSVLLLFAALRRMTGSAWPAALTAALFAVHPLNVESVAWVSERKGVLSTFFFMLTLWAYARYAERRSLARYLTVALGLLLGLLAKPMLVTLPFVLLLLDYWPLRRWQADGSRVSLLVEKLPLLAIVAAFAVIAGIAQKSAGALPSLQSLPLEARLKNAAVSYVVCLGRALWPHHLAAFYPPPPGGVPQWQAVAALGLLAAVTVGTVWRAGRAPYLVVGWLGFLGTLVPVIGLVQVGRHVQADRYTYVPLIGLFMAFAWGLADLAVWTGWRRPVWSLGAAIVLGCAAATWRQVHTWRDSLTLWRQVLEVTAENSRAHFGLGEALAANRQVGAAISHYREAVRLSPNHVEAHFNLACILRDQGQTHAAIHHYREGLRFRPDSVEMRCALADVLSSQGRTEEAAAEYRRSLELDPRCEAARLGLERVMKD